MANAIYPSYKQSILSGDANTSLTGSGDTGLYIALIDTGVYTYSAAHQFYSSLSGVIATQEVQGVITTNGMVDGNSVLFPAVTGNVGALVFYRKNTGANTTWRLIAYIDTGQFGIPVSLTNSDMTMNWDPIGIFSVFDFVAEAFINVDRFVDTDSFITAALTTTANIGGTLYTNPDTFYASSTSGGAVGFPNASNTGVPVGTVLTASGSITTTSNGQIIQDRLVTGGIQVNHNNVTIRRCRVIQTSFNGIQVGAPDENFGGGCIIEDCEVDGQDNHLCIGTWTPQSLAAVEIRRCNLHHAENCVGIAGPMVLEDCYMHTMTSDAVDPHYDNIECNGGSNILIQHNNVINDYNQTAACMLNNFFGGLSNITVNNNRFEGGGYTLYCDNSFSGGTVQGSTIFITNNRFIRGFWGYMSLYTSNVQLSGNVDDLTGESID